MSRMQLDSRDAGILLVLVLVTTAVYAPALPGATFVYDDYPLMLSNPRVTDGLPLRAFVDFENGRPLTLLSFRINYGLSGESAIAFRTVNLVVHLLAVGLLFLLIQDLSRSRAAATAGALLFALHPLQSQAISYVWSRSMLLMAVFSIAALLSRRRPVLALILFQLAVWSRAEALVLILPLLLLERRRSARFAIAAVAVTALNLTALLVGIWHGASGIAWDYWQPWAYWASAPRALWHYAAAFAWPVSFSIDHEFVPPDLLELGLTLGALGALLAATVVLFRRDAFAGGCIGWALLWLAPSLLVPNADVFNESRAYLALAGPAALAGVAVTRWISDRLLAAAVLTIGLVLMLPITASRVRLWNDEVGLWTEAVSAYPDSAHAHYNLGAARVRRDQLVEAEQAFLEAYRIDQGHDDALAAIGYCRQRATDLQGAEWYYQEALRLNPGNEYARQLLGGLPSD